MLNRLKMTFRALLRRSELERSLDEELRDHIERQTDQNIRLGMDPQEARHAARRAFGGVEQAKERSRDARGLRWLGELFQDLRFGARMSIKNPGFTTVAVLTLSLGIGACAAIFSIVDAVVMRPLPYPDSERILSLREVDAKGRQITFAEANFLDVRARNRTLAATAEYVSFLTTVLGGSEPVRARVAYVSNDFFRVLGVQPAIGRSFLPEESKVGANPVVAVSAGFWQRLLGGRRDLGETPLRIEEVNYTTVGVMPPGFNFPKDVEIWLPIELEPQSGSRTAHGIDTRWW